MEKNSSKTTEKKCNESEEKSGSKSCENSDLLLGCDQSENNHCDTRNITYVGNKTIYTDPKTGVQYDWDMDKTEWKVIENQYEYEDDTYVYTGEDGMKYFWDNEKRAWFPKINDDFMAMYQLNYGFVDNASSPTKVSESQISKDVEKVETKCEKRKPSESQWFEVDQQNNTKVYVSNLPTDISEQEFIDFMQKCGLILRDPVNGDMKIKFYKEPNTDILKGDALCTYIKKESVDLALNILDGADLKGKKVKVEVATFQMKGDYDPKLKPKTKKRKDKEKHKKMQEKLFDWRPEKRFGDQPKHEKVVIVKNAFDPKDFDTDVSLILELQEDFRTECAKCGEVKKVIIYDRHPEGIVQVNMKEFEAATACVTLLNGRWFSKKQLMAQIWDGKTKFKIMETDAQINERLENWDNFLEQDGNSKKDTTETIL